MIVRLSNDTLVNVKYIVHIGRKDEYGRDLRHVILLQNRDNFPLYVNEEDYQLILLALEKTEGLL